MEVDSFLQGKPDALTFSSNKPIGNLASPFKFNVGSFFIKLILIFSLPFLSSFLSFSHPLFAQEKR
jgi:hypothetical protein